MWGKELIKQKIKNKKDRLSSETKSQEQDVNLRARPWRGLDQQTHWSSARILGDQVAQTLSHGWLFVSLHLPSHQTSKKNKSGTYDLWLARRGWPENGRTLGETWSTDTHSISNHFKPASMAWLRIAAGKLDVSYAQTSVSSKSSTTCVCQPRRTDKNRV